MIARLRAAASRLPPDIALLAGFLALLIPFRVHHATQTRWMLIDGGYYVEVARHVRDGLGLTTHESLYHAAFPHFPYPTTVYPLWPLVLGYLARLIDLTVLAHWLPLLFYFLAVIAAFAFGRRAAPEPLFPSALPAFHGGHVAALLLGLHRDFLAFTTLPYTEGLSWTLLFAFLWRAHRRSGDLGLGWAVEQGVWMALLYFARAQFILVPIALFGALKLRFLLGPDRRPAAVHGAVAAMATLLPIGVWFAWIRSFTVDAGLSSLLRFDQNRAAHGLSGFEVIVDSTGGASTLLDRLEGLGIAFDPTGSHHYAETFNGMEWAFPFALPFLAFAMVALSRRDALRAGVARLRRADGFAWMVTGLVAAGGLLSTHLIHKQFNGEWYFDRRQGMVSLPAFLLCLLYLLRSRIAFARVLGVLVLSTTFMLGARQVWAQSSQQGGELRGPDRWLDLVSWLNRASKDEDIVVAMQEGELQRIGWRTRHVGYHWIWDNTSYDDLLYITDKLGAKYVLYSPSTVTKWQMIKQGAGRIAADFQELPDHPNGYTILERRAETLPELPPQRVMLVGVDGASWKVMGPMIDNGELPSFAQLAHEGAAQTDFDTLSVTDSPVIWTTVATGQSPKVHGVEDYTETVEGVGKIPITSNARKVQALWNVASSYQKSVAVVNWWASWPAEEVNGTVVSDHANPAAAGWMEGKYWEADPSALAALQKDTFPAALAESLRPAWLDPAAFPVDDFAVRSRLSEAQLAAMQAAPFNERTTYSWLKTFYAVDRPHLEIGLERWRAARPDLLMLYLRGPDPVQHYAWDTVEPWRYARQPDDLARDRGVVPGIYRYVDSFLAEAMAACDENTTLIVMSDHGAEPAPGASDPRRTDRPGGHTRTAKGVLFLYGPHVKAGLRIARAGPLDIAPTIAWVMGLPVPDDAPGRVLSEAFRTDFAARRPALRIPTWGAREPSAIPSTASPADASMLEQLRGLGYVE